MTRTRSAWVLAVGLALFLQACGGDEGGTEAEADSGTSQTAQYETLEEDVLSVVTNLSLEPYRYQEDGKMGGFEIELTEKIAENLGFESVTWANINWDSLMTDIAANKHDVAIAGINGWAEPGTPIHEVVEDRTEIVSFSRPYFLPYWALVTSENHNPGLASVDDLEDGMSLQVLEGTTEFFWARDNLAPKGVDVRAGKDVSANFAVVESGLVDATIEEGTSLQKALEAHPGLVEGDPVEGLSAGFGWAFSHDRTALREAFNEELGRMLESSEYQELYEEFFPWLDAPTSLPDSSFVG